jgi:hypothetical protein
MPKLSPEDLRALILRRLVISPMSLAEIEEELRIDQGVSRQIIRGLIAENTVRLLADPRREGGPFYCLRDYREETTRVEFSAAYDYSSHYENQLDDNQDGTFSGIRSW